MALETLLASLKCGVTEVAWVPASDTKAFACNPAKLREVAEVSGNTFGTSTVTPVTPAKTRGISAKRTPTGACTLVTRVTRKKINGEDGGPNIDTEGETITSRWWLLHYVDHDPTEVSFAFELSHAEILERYEDAIAAEPITPISLADGRYTCNQCRHLSGRVCSVAGPGNQVSASRGYTPQLNTLIRCAGYATKKGNV